MGRGLLVPLLTGAILLGGSIGVVDCPVVERNPDPPPTIIQTSGPPIPEPDIRVFEVTAYTLEDGSGTGLTSTGRIPTVGRTIAVDPKVIPYDSIVIIDGQKYVAEDTGGDIKGHRLDIYMGSGRGAYEKAIKFGRRTMEIIIEEKGELE